MYIVLFKTHSVAVAVEPKCKMPFRYLCVFKRQQL